MVKISFFFGFISPKKYTMDMTLLAQNNLSTIGNLFFFFEVDFSGLPLLYIGLGFVNA
jgi:hypothetical protein